MFKLSNLFLILALVIGLLTPTGSVSSSGLTAPVSASEPICGSTTTVRLLSDKNVDTGTLTVANGETSLIVTYTTKPNYKLTATHLAIANSLAGIPKTNKGNPVPGQFPFQTNHNKVATFTYTIPLSGLSSTIYIAAHADVLKSGAKKTEGAWGEGTLFNPGQRSWGMYFTYAIQPCNEPPTAGDDDYAVDEDMPLNVTAPGVLTNDSDPDGDPITAELVTSTIHGTLNLNTDGSFTYSPDANYNGPDSFTYQAKDSFGNLSNTATVSILINPVDDLPVAVNDIKSVAENAAATVIDVLANDSDADGESFTIASATDPGNGTVVVAGDGLSLTYQPDAGYCNDGSPTDDFTYSLDPGGSTATVAVTVVCVDDAPVAIDDTATVDEDSGPNTIDVLGNDFDPDGGSNSIDSVTQPANGTVVITNGGADLTYEPDSNSCNDGTPTDDFMYTLAPGGTTATVSVTVNCIDDAPTALNDSATVDEDSSPTSIDVLGNETDVDGGPISILSVTQPADGSVVITGGGTGLTYEPDANACNDGTPTDNFTYTLAPGGSVGTVSVTVTCINDAPSFDLPASPNQTVIQDAGPQTVSGFATNISAGPANESGQTVTFIVSNDNNALFSSQPDIDASTGDLTYESASSMTGSAIVSVSLNDNGGTANGGDDTSDTQTFTITVTPPNAGPIALDQSVSTNEDTSKMITLSATDADGDTLSFSIVDNPADGSLGSLGLVNCAGNTCTVDVNYTPDADFNGSDSFTFKANDGNGDSNTATVSIAVEAVNDAPSFTSGGDVTVAEDSGAYSAAWATGISAGPANENGQTLSFSIQSNNNPSLFSVAPSIAPDGTLSFTLAANANGTATLSVLLEDDGGTANGGVDVSSAVNFDIIVTGVNDPPANTVPGAESVDEDTDLTFSTANGNPLSVADSDAGAGNIQVTVSALNGTITVVEPGVTISGSGTASAIITGTLTQVNAALDGLTYKGNLNFNSTRGSEILTLVTNDQGNTGSGGALSDTDTVNITVNAVNDAPSAVAKDYTAQANMKITGLTGLLTGATDPDTGDGGYTATLTVGTVSATSPAGGTISNLNTATGSFDFDPPPGATGNVTFTYTVCDSGNPAPSACSAPATVTVNVSGPVIWFVNAAVAGPGTGTLSDPFKTLASADAVDAANHRIFLFSGTYANGITLNSGEWLVGQGVTGFASFDVLMGITPPSGTLARPTLGAGGATVQGTVTLATNAIVKAITISTSGATQGLAGSGGITGVDVTQTSISTATGTALSLNNVAGTLSLGSVSANGAATGVDLTNVGAAVTISSGTIQNTTTAGVSISGGTGNFTQNFSTLSNTTGRTILVQNRTGGTVSFTGTINGGGTGILLNNNTGSTIDFPAGTAINLSTGANAAFTATGGGTLNVAGNNAITTTTGTALTVQNTTIGASGLTFRTISVNGAAKGIVLNNTGTSGGLTVTGTGTTDGSGGTIQNTTTRGAEFINARNITLKNITFTNAVTIDFPAAPTGLSLGNNTADNAVIHLQGVTTALLDNIDINGSAEHGINGHNVSGFTLSNSTIVNAGNGADEDGIHFYNLVGTSAITNTTVTSSGDDNVNIQNNNNLPGDLPQSTTGQITITGGSANTGVLGSGYLFGIRGTMNTTIDILNVTSNNNFSGGIVADSFDTATMSLEVSGSTITNNNDGIQVSAHNGNADFDIHDNNPFTGQDFLNITILKSAFSTSGSLEGYIRNNTFNVADGRPTDSIFIFNAGGSALNIVLSSNVINYRGTQRAILIQTGQDGSGAINATLTGNTIDMQLDGTGNAVTGILAQSGITSPSGDGSSICADIGGAGALSNTFTHSLGGTMAAGDIRIRQRNNGTARLPGYAGAATDTAAVVAYLTGRNTLVNSPTATATADSTGFGGGGACTQPTP